MKPTLALIIAVALLASASHAAVIERDWLAPGDGLLTYDNVNQREWLDVPESLLSQFAPDQSLVVALDIALMELEPGGRFEDFTWATQADVFALAESAGIDTSTDDFATNEQTTRELIDFLGPTLVLSPNDPLRSIATYGVVQATEGESESAPYIIITRTPSALAAGIGSFNSFIGVDSPSTFTGLFLYRQVPEPSSYLLVVLSVIVLVFVRRQQMAIC